MVSKPKKSRRYMDILNINDEHQVLAKIRNLASELSEHEHLVRSCMFDLHAAIEIELRRIFFFRFFDLLFFTEDRERNAIVKTHYEKMIDRLSFMDMWRVLRPIMNDWDPSFENIEQINNTRNQVAHGEISKVQYKGRNPFDESDCLCQLYLDVWSVKKAIPKFFEHMLLPYYRCRAYNEKYGEITLSAEIIQSVDDWYKDQ